MAVKKSLIAQAKCLRAYYYFILTTTYGNIPLHLKVETPEELQSPAKPQDQFICKSNRISMMRFRTWPIRQLLFPLDRLPKDPHMVCLQKLIYLMQTSPIIISLRRMRQQKVVATGYYQSHQIILQIISMMPKKNNTEAVFTVNHLANNTPNDNNVFFTPRDRGGYGFYYPTQDLVSQFETAPGGEVDPRLDYTVGREGVSYYDLGWDPAWTTTGYLCKKWVQPLAVIPQNNRGQGDLNYEAIRYSEVLLIQAEALNESGQSAAALAPLNAVRKRARNLIYTTIRCQDSEQYLPDYYQMSQPPTRSQLRDAIRQERRVELALEFHRFYDIIRYGADYANATLKPVSANFDYDKNKWFPIPQSERDTNKKLGL